MSVSGFGRLPQAFSTSATALGKRFSSMSHNTETFTLGSLAKPSERADPRERIPMIAMLTVLFGLCRAKPVLIQLIPGGPAPIKLVRPVRPVAPALTCLTKLRRLMDVMIFLLALLWKCPTSCQLVAGAWKNRLPKPTTSWQLVGQMPLRTSRVEKF